MYINFQTKVDRESEEEPLTFYVRTRIFLNGNYEEFLWHRCGALPLLDEPIDPDGSPGTRLPALVSPEEVKIITSKRITRVFDDLRKAERYIARFKHAFDELRQYWARVDTFEGDENYPQA